MCLNRILVQQNCLINQKKKMQMQGKVDKNWNLEERKETGQGKEKVDIKETNTRTLVNRGQ